MSEWAVGHVILRNYVDVEAGESFDACGEIVW